MNAEMGRELLGALKVRDAAAVYDRARQEGANESRTAAAWRKSDRIPGLPVSGKTVYPDVRFDADGQPWPLMRHGLRTWPCDWSARLRVFRMVSPNEHLDGGVPHETRRTGDRNAIEAAENAGPDADRVTLKRPVGVHPAQVHRIPSGTVPCRTHRRDCPGARFDPCPGSATRFAPLSNAGGDCIPTSDAATTFDGAARETVVPGPPGPFTPVPRQDPDIRGVSRIAPEAGLDLVPLFPPEPIVPRWDRTALFRPPAKAMGRAAPWRKWLGATLCGRIASSGTRCATSQPRRRSFSAIDRRAPTSIRSTGGRSPVTRLSPRAVGPGSNRQMTPRCRILRSATRNQGHEAARGMAWRHSADFCRAGRDTAKRPCRGRFIGVRSCR